MKENSDTRHIISKRKKDENKKKKNNLKQITLDNFFKSKQYKECNEIKNITAFNKNETSSYSTDFKSEGFAKSNSLQSVQTIHLENDRIFALKDCKELLNFSMIIQNTDTHLLESGSNCNFNSNLNNTLFSSSNSKSAYQSNNKSKIKKDYTSFLSNSTLESRIQPIEYLEDIEKELIDQIDKNPYEEYSLLQKDYSNMRKTLIEWGIIFRITMNFRHETLFLAFFLFDKITKISTNKYSYSNNSSSDILNNFKVTDLNYLMKTCLFLSAKYEEVDLPEYNDYFSPDSGNEFMQKSQVLKLEYNVLSKLEFNICFTTAYKYSMFLRLKTDEIFFKETILLSMLYYYNFHKDKLCNFTIKCISFSMFYINFYMNTTYSRNPDYNYFNSINSCNSYDYYDAYEQLIIREMNIDIEDFLFGIFIWSNLSNIDIGSGNYSFSRIDIDSDVQTSFFEKQKNNTNFQSNLFDLLSGSSNSKFEKKINSNSQNKLKSNESGKEVEFKKNVRSLDTNTKNSKSFLFEEDIIDGTNFKYSQSYHSKNLLRIIKKLKENKFLEELSQIKLFTKLLLIELLKDIRKYETQNDTNEGPDIIQILFLDILKPEKASIVSLNSLHQYSLYDEDLNVIRSKRNKDQYNSFIKQISILKEINQVDTFKNLIDK